MEDIEYTGNWLKTLIEKLNLPSTAEFCRKAGLNRGLVDKLMAGAHSPRMDTLVKIKKAFPQTNMNWLVSGSGYVLEDELDDQETVILELYRKKIKLRDDSHFTKTFLLTIDWFAQEEDEWKQMDINAEAVELEKGELADFRSTLLLKQRQRRLIIDLLQIEKEKPRGLLDIKTRHKELNELLNKVNDSIQKIINLYEQKE